MNQNVGNLDRLVRATAGIGLLIVATRRHGLGKLAALGLGAALLTTSATAHCPAYSALGTDTLDH